MKGRLVDTLLIITLVLVAFGITYTLLTLNRGQQRTLRDRPTVAESSGTAPGPQAPGGSNSVEPLAPGGTDPAPGQPGTLQPIRPGMEPDVADAESEDAADPVVADEELPVEPEEPAPPPRTLAAGEVELERIGFSLVTGGAGACGVVLEEWQHVAVSREILADLGCGAAITLHLDEPVAGRSTLSVVIGDTMNPAHSRTVNIYVGEDEPALEYGVATGTFEVN